MPKHKDPNPRRALRGKNTSPFSPFHSLAVELLLTEAEEQRDQLKWQQANASYDAALRWNWSDIRAMRGKAAVLREQGSDEAEYWSKLVSFNELSTSAIPPISAPPAPKIASPLDDNIPEPPAIVALREKFANKRSANEIKVEPQQSGPSQPSHRQL